MAPKERTYKEFLFLPSRDTEAERWTGEREPIAAALRAKYGFEKIMRTGSLMGTLVGLASRSPTFWQVVQPFGEDGKPKDQQGIGEDRPDQGGLDDHDEARLQGEDRDEQFGQVAER